MHGCACRAGLLQQGGAQSPASAWALPPVEQWGRVWDSGAWWMLLAAQSMAVGTVLVPWVSRKADNVMATGYHMLLGGLPLAALAYTQEAGMLAERLPQLTGMLADGLLSIYSGAPVRTQLWRRTCPIAGSLKHAPCNAPLHSCLLLYEYCHLDNTSLYIRRVPVQQSVAWHALLMAVLDI